MASIYVIIPCYNARKYLEQAVDSVLTQPSKNIDIVLVDDGSTDGTEVLCDQLSARHERVTVIHKENGGVSSARNAGIEYTLSKVSSGGTFVAFLDADDAWVPGFLNDSVEELLNSGYDLIGFQSCNCNQNLRRNESLRQMRHTGYLHGGAANVWSHSTQHFGAMFYSVALLHKYCVRFQAGLKYSEDKKFSMQCLYLADAIYLENRIMYLYRRISTSAVSTRKYGIPYYIPIVDAYLELDMAMEKWATGQRGTLYTGRHCANVYLMDMIDEHFQQWRRKRNIDHLLETHPEYVALLKSESPFRFIPLNTRFVEYSENPSGYILKQYIKGVFCFFRRCASYIYKRI